MSLLVRPGEAVALLGRNGSGKTTTLLTIAGALRPSAGVVTLAGTNLAGRAAFRVARSGLALVPQGRRIFPTLSVSENLSLGGGGERLQAVQRMFPILAERATQPGTALSGGEQQMLAIGRALMSAPRILLMDEPSEGLAPQVVRDVGLLLGRLRRDSGLAILIAEQNLKLALDVADRVYILERGEVVHQAAAAEFRGDAVRQHRFLGV